MTVVTEDFEAHVNLLRDVMMRQAGTLTKALLEGIMNSVDAGAKKCKIVIDEDGKFVQVIDNGKGFKDVEEIRRNFKVLGQPHSEQEKLEKTYGNFRMGRGQMFSYGVNTWETGKFVMSVDLKHKGLKYELQELDKGKKGCRVTIQLYSELLPSQRESLIRNLKEAAAWVPIPVYIGDELISQNPEKAKWDYESESCYLKLDTSGSLAIYNLGVLVCHKPEHYFGHGGILVSKKQLKLNFARNDVMEDVCKVWKEAKAFAKKQARKATKRRKSWTTAERQRVVDDLIASDIDPDEDLNVEAAPLFTATNGRHYSINNLARQRYKYPKWTVAPKDNVLADKIFQQERAFVIAQQTLTRFHVDTPEEFLAVLYQTDIGQKARNIFERWEFAEFHKLKSDYNEVDTILDEKQYTPSERVWVRQMQGINRRLADLAGSKQRKLLLGVSDRCNGWTDGSTYIAIDRGFLQGLRGYEIHGCFAVLRLLLHEYCHDDASNADTARHTNEFYEQFHDVSKTPRFSWLLTELVQGYQKAAKAERKKLGRMALKVADRLRAGELADQIETARMQTLEKQLQDVTELAASCKKAK